MQDRPEFNSEHPDDESLTPEEQAVFDEAMRRRRELQAVENEIPEIGAESRREQ